MISKSIYKRDSTGALRQWYYEVDGDRWRSFHGVVGGTLAASGWTTCVPRSQPTAELQARFEAEAEMDKKLERDYHRNAEDVDKPHYFKPMLAHKYEGWTPSDEARYSQPKLDGIRCIATARGLFSRQGKQIFGVPHVEGALEHLFDKHPGLILDGELYNHDLREDFNQITSLVRKQNPSAEQMAKARDLIQYHVYDVPSLAERFHGRSHFVDHHVPHNSTIRVVETKPIFSEDQLDAVYQAYMESGYEGQIVRLNRYYEQKRSKALLKRKEFIDQEFEIVSVDEGNGNWAGCAKRLTCRLPDGRLFGAGIKGTQAYCAQLLRDADSYVGRQATIRYFALTPDGVPRFPVAVDVGRDGF